ncbi:BspA family leucine-rich repeat surface protein [Dokdonia sp.]|uniref:BspA family leucine-rich repeat surface protein n=1 Tax=Dokdonia sp. TaxID=2024995 RepID=UPI0032642521
MKKLPPFLIILFFLNTTILAQEFQKEQSNDTLQSLERVYKQAENDSVKFFSLLKLSRYKTQRGFSNAEQHLDEALAIYNTQKHTIDAVYLGDIYRLYATLNSNQGNYTESLAFNRPLNNWNVSSVSGINYMFFEAQAFNQPLDNWDVSNVTSMASMFESCQAFDQNIGGWDISSVVSVSNFDGLNNMFRSAGISRVNYDNTLIGWNTLDSEETRIPVDIQFNGGNSNYCLSETARQNLIDSSNWIITDGDLSCPIGDVIVPHVVDLSQTNAATTLINGGLQTGTLTGVYSDTIPAGTIISQLIYVVPRI